MLCINVNITLFCHMARFIFYNSFYYQYSCISIKLELDFENVSDKQIYSEHLKLQSQYLSQMIFSNS